MKMITRLFLLLSLVFIPCLVSANQDAARIQFNLALADRGGIFAVYPALNSFVSEIGEKIAGQQKVQRSYTYHVSNESNADSWSMPGGYVVVTRGLVARLDNAAQLAAVLAHETYHASQIYDKSRRLGRGSKGAYQLMLARDSNYVLGRAALLLWLGSHQHDRIDELQADRMGQDWLAAIGYDPAVFEEVITEETTSPVPGLDRHPYSSERVDRIREHVLRLSAKMPEASWKLGENEYARFRDVLSQTAESYKFADMAMCRKLSSGLRRIAAAIDRWPEGLAEDPLIYSSKAILEAESMQCELALDTFEKALALDAERYNDWLVKARCLQRLGQVQEAVDAYQRSKNILSSANATRALADLEYLQGNRAAAKKHYLELMSSPGRYREDAAGKFERMDIEDNPRIYFRSSSTVQEGRLKTILYNLTNRPVRELKVRFEVTLGNKEIEKLVEAGPLPSFGQLYIDPEVNMEDVAQLKRIRAYVIAIGLE